MRAVRNQRASRAIRRALQKAHRQYETGAFSQSAAMFAELAEMAENRGRPEAPFLWLKAGRSTLYGGHSAEAHSMFRRALTLASGPGKAHRIRMIVDRLIDDLRSAGFNGDAAELQQTAYAVVSDSDPSRPIEPADLRPRRLAGKCPHCGATVREDEVEWLDRSSAICSYCGSVLQAN